MENQMRNASMQCAKAAMPLSRRDMYGDAILLFFVEVLICQPAEKERVIFV